MKRLLELLLKKYLEHNQYGLCTAVKRLRYDLDLDFDAYFELLTYLHDNIPVEEFFDSTGSLTDDTYKFWYPIGQTKERLEWLEKHIKLNS